MGLNALRRLSRTIPELQPRTKDMKKLLTIAAIIAASAVPASAQRAGPGPTAYTGTGPGVLPPGGVGPSSPLKNLTEWSAVPSWTATPMLTGRPSQVLRK